MIAGVAYVSRQRPVADPAHSDIERARSGRSVISRATRRPRRQHDPALLARQFAFDSRFRRLSDPARPAEAQRSPGTARSISRRWASISFASAGSPSPPRSPTEPHIPRRNGWPHSRTGNSPGPASVAALQIAGPGSIRIEEDAARLHLHFQLDDGIGLLFRILCRGGQCSGRHR